jgi:hypothetical protein
MAARIAMMAMTTNSSINVKAGIERRAHRKQGKRNGELI